MNPKKPRFSNKDVKARISKARGFIFDMDGTLLNSHDAHFKAWDRVTREHGFPYEKEEIVAQFGKKKKSVFVQRIHAILFFRQMP